MLELVCGAQVENAPQLQISSRVPCLAFSSMTRTVKHVKQTSIMLPLSEVIHNHSFQNAFSWGSILQQVLYNFSLTSTNIDNTKLQQIISQSMML